MSKAKNKKQKQSADTPMDNASATDSTADKAVSDTGTETKRELKNENMFRMWNARPTQVPKVPRAKAGGATGSGASTGGSSESVEFAIDWKTISIAATMIGVLAIFSHITGLFGQFVLNDQLILTPLKMGANSDEFWSRLVGSGLMTPLSCLWTNVGLSMDLKSTSLIWFHMVNLTLHALTSVYLFFLVFQLGRYWSFENRIDVKPEYFAFAAAGLFACHPLASEIVSYIPGREMGLVGANYILAMFLFFAAFIARKPLTMILLYTAMLACIVMAVLSGPAAITIPIALVCLAVLAKPPEMSFDEFVKLRWSDLTIIGMVAAAIIYAITRGIPTTLNNGIGLATLPFDQYLASQFKAFATYFLRCFFVPGGLSVEPPLVVATGFTDPLALLGIAAVGGIAFLAYKYRSIPPVVLGLTMTLIGPFPDFVLPQGEIISDARYYISLAGLAIVFGWVVAKMAIPSFKQVVATIVILFVGLAGLSNWRALAWATDAGLWKEILKTNPQSARAHAKLGFIALLDKKVSEAKKEADEALKLDPQLPIAHLLLGRIQQSEGATAEAFKEFETALKLAQDSKSSPIVVAQCQAQLADALVRQGDYARVKKLVDEARGVLGDTAQLHYLMGMHLLNRKEYVPAIYELQQGFVQDQRNNQYVEPLVTAYLGSRMPSLIPQAYKLMERSLKGLPTAEGQLLFARAALELNRIDEAKEAIETGSKLGADEAQVNYLQYFVARAQKNAAQAAAFKAKALALDPKIETNLPVVPPDEIKKYLDQEMRKSVPAPSAPATPPATPPATTTAAPAQTEPAATNPATSSPAPAVTSPAESAPPAKTDATPKGEGASVQKTTTPDASQPAAKPAGKP